SWSLRPLAIFAVVVVIILALSVVGLGIDVDPDSPFLYPAAPAEQDPEAPTSTAPATDIPTENAIPAIATVYDPFGDGFENDETVTAVVDGIQSTVWRTEPYPDPLGETKEGVGIVLEPPVTIGAIEVTGTPETRFTVAWNATLPDVPGEWDRIGAAQILTGSTRLDVAQREEGYWLVWITALPEQDDGTYGASISEIRLLP
ncbi:MAG: hypothetical protein WBN35_10490, partial [Acidimicrobiia bacterium]